MKNNLELVVNERFIALVRALKNVHGIGQSAIARTLNLPPNLSSHHFRKTAGMIWLNNNVPLETVSELLGDTVAVVRQHYARVIEEKIARDMADFSERMKAKNEKAALKKRGL